MAEVLQMRGIHKRFGNTHALKGVDFALRAGEAHALLGENGSGKSTLMKIAAGEVTSDSGALLLRGELLTLANPLQAARAGITMVAQEVPVVPSLTVAENIALGSLPGHSFRVDWRQTSRIAREALAELGSAVRPEQFVSELNPADRQVVSIARAVAAQSAVVIFDEPTSSLTAELAESLFESIRRMKARGIAVAFISQRLQDIAPVADRVTVLRDGNVVDTLDIEVADEAVITRLMVGRALTDYFHTEIGTQAPEIGDPVVSVRDLTVPGRVHGVSFDLRPAEIVGIAGLVGCGRVDVVRAIFGADSSSGEVTIAGKPYSRRSPRGSIKRGISLVPGDRKTEGLFASASVLHNLSVIGNNRLSLRPIRASKQRNVALATMRELQVRPDDPNLPAGSLSGGNQQKVVIGRWVSQNPRVLLMDEPTRGVDVGATSEIYRIVRELAGQGVAVLVSSSENVELLGLCDRVLMMLHGRIVSDMPSSELDELTIAEQVAGVEHHV